MIIRYWHSIPRGEESSHTCYAEDAYCDVCTPKITLREGCDDEYWVDHVPLGFWRAALFWFLFILALPFFRYALHLKRPR